MLFTVAGIIGEHATLVNDSQLVKDIPGELSSMSRHLPAAALHGRGGDPHPVRPIEPSEMVQWEQHLEEGEKQAIEAAEALYVAREDKEGESEASSSSARSHRRRRQLAEHHKHFLRGTGPENPKTQTTIIAP